jgi:hypothetical protein
MRDGEVSSADGLSQLVDSVSQRVEGSDSVVRPLVPRANFVNHPRKRLKSGPEIYAQRIRKQPSTTSSGRSALSGSTKHRITKCGFCNESSHTKASCSKFRRWASASNNVLQQKGRHQEAFLQFFENLGNRSYFTVDDPTDDLQQVEVDALESNKVKPRSAYHFVVEKLFSSPWASSEHRSDGENVVQVQFLDRNGDELSTGITFVKVKHFKTWLSKIKGGGKVFSNLTFLQSRSPAVTTEA